MYGTVKALQTHLRMTHDIFEFDAKEHRITKMSDITHACSICNKPCILTRFCADHRKVRSQTEESVNNCETHSGCHSCVVCSTKFPDCQSLWLHIFSNHKDSFISCNLCSTMPASKFTSVLLRHVSKHHRNSPILSTFRESCRQIVDGVVTYQCCHCPTRMKSFTALRDHMHRHAQEKPHVCSICQMEFPFARNLARHQNLEHRNVRIHDCNHCGQKFFKKQDLEVHVRIHTGERKFMCDECGASFTQWTSLKYHKNTHSSVRHKCPFCENTYKHPHHMKKHMKVHTGQVKHYMCHLCARDFTNPYVLKRHMVVHSNVRPFVCVYCGSLFKLNKTLARHQTTCKFALAEKTNKP
uniref:Zinc finger protein 835 n=1 Tax=Cacopsylla melanoneura TaxID=428564 RepID=A0A8D8Z329_9HEMI